MNQKELCAKLERLELLHRVGLALSTEKNKERLVEMILLEAKKLCNADGGTLYLRNRQDQLRFAIVRSRSLGLALGGTTGRSINMPPIPLYNEDGAPNKRNVATWACFQRESVNIPDAYNAEGFDFSGTKEFDTRNGYRSKSFLTIPLVNQEDYVIGVIQLINAVDPNNGEVVPFHRNTQEIVEALASQAAIALDNQILLDGQKILMESFIKMIAAAIDAKSPHTGQHCARVPLLTEMLARAACDAKEGAFADFDLSEREWYELRIAAWMHDCGKITTPVHVIEKATKLETIFDRIEIIRSRFEILMRDAELAYLKALRAGEGDPRVLEERYEREVDILKAELAFLEKINLGGEYLPPHEAKRIHEIGARVYTEGGQTRKLLTEDEIRNLSISKGTLTEEERRVINGHMVHTIKMLESLPFPRHLQRVPEYAGGHHERMDGGGYPKGLFAGDMSVPARIMAIADVFEALTAKDRPYKKGKTLSETMNIMARMKENNHLDPDLLDLLVTSGVYRRYARRFLSEDLIDEVDESSILGAEPKPFEMPDEAERNKRREGFRAEYRAFDRALDVRNRDAEFDSANGLHD